MEDGFSLRDSTIGIVGLGLMGGSLAMALKGKCARLIGFDSHPPALELALSHQIVDHAQAFPSAGRVAPQDFGGAYRDHNIDILILATPVPAIINILQQLLSLISHPCILLDLGSTKRNITQAMSALPDNFAPLGGHPICGREKLGLENADAKVYQDAPFIITPLERTTQYALRIVRELISAVGAHPIEMTTEEHDRVLASTSHLPFLVSSALAHSTPREFTSLIGPGFRSTSRLAGTPSSMMMGILQSNRDNVLNAIQTFRQSLDEIEVALEDENYPELQALLDQSCDSYHSLTNN